MGRENGTQGNLWAFFPQQQEQSAALAEALQIPLPLAQILINRGITSAAAGTEFLQPHPEQLYSPFAMRDMDTAVNLILQAINKGEKLAVYGDYDVDGVAATAIMITVLQRLGANVSSYLPQRLGEGYGLHEDRLAGLAREGVSLVITVDCGISNGNEVVFAREHGMDVVITDHHLPPGQLPPAAAVVNPRRPDCSYPFKDLCGAGIAYKLGQALLSRADQRAHRQDLQSDPWLGMADCLDLAALATVADVVPLLGENRVLVAHGLRRMDAGLRPGLSALCELVGAGRAITSETIAYLLAPRLNAAGRMGDASRALTLLLADQPDDARIMATQLHEENIRRQTIETRILAEAAEMAGMLPRDEQDVLLLAAAGWHRGVIGIVASRILEMYNRPAMLISLENGQGKGSGRSRGDFDLFAALSACDHLLLGYGGHRSAAGLTVPQENIPLLRRELNKLARQIMQEGKPAPEFYVDTPLDSPQITAELVRGMERLEPFGCGNPKPLFLGQRWLLERKKEVGRGQRHLQLGLSRDRTYFPAICFNGKEKLPDLQLMRELNIFFTPAFDSWRGDNTLQLEIYRATYCDEHAREGLSIVDQRGLGKKDTYLRGLCQTGDYCLVYVNTLSRLASLQRLPGIGKELLISHQGQFPAIGHFPQAAHLVLYDLPLEEQKLQRILHAQTGKKGLKVHLLYGAADWKNNQRLLTATVPSFAVLEYIVDILREKAAQQQQIALDETLALLQQRLPFSATKSLLEKCLQIMEQTACLVPDKENMRLKPDCRDDYCSMLNKMAGTEIYSQSKIRWQESLRWQKIMLEAEPGEIVALISEGVRQSQR